MGSFFWIAAGRKVGQILEATTRDDIAGIHFQMIAPLGRVGLLLRLEIFPINDENSTPLQREHPAHVRNVG